MLELSCGRLSFCTDTGICISRGQTKPLVMYSFQTTAMLYLLVLDFVRGQSVDERRKVCEIRFF